MEDGEDLAKPNPTQPKPNQTRLQSNASQSNPFFSLSPLQCSLDPSYRLRFTRPSSSFPPTVTFPFSVPACVFLLVALCACVVLPLNLARREH